MKRGTRQESDGRAPAQPHRWALGLVVPCLIAAGCDGREAADAEMTCDEFIAAIRRGESPNARPFRSTRGWDNDAVVDALADALERARPSPETIKRGRAPRHLAAAYLANGGVQRPGRTRDSRRGRYMLPARVAPALIAALAADDAPTGGAYRRNLLVALGRIDAPTPEVVATLLRALAADDPTIVATGVDVVGRRGIYAAAAADELERMLGRDVAGRRIESHGRAGRVDDRVGIAGALARVSAEPHPRALAALIRSVRGDRDRSAKRASNTSGIWVRGRRRLSTTSWRSSPRRIATGRLSPPRL